MRVEWNRELFAAVAVAYHSLLCSLPREMEQRWESMYRYWPTRDALALEELEQAMLAPLYASASESALFVVPPRELEDRSDAKRLCRLDEGYVLARGMDVRTEAFVRQHFSVFDLPPALADHLLSTAPRTKPFTPVALRAYLHRKLSDPKKRERLLTTAQWSSMHSANFVLDLLALCLQDLSSSARSYGQLAGLHLLPLARGQLAQLGAGSHIVASVDEQSLLPHLAERFTSPACVEHKAVGALFAKSAEFRSALKLRELDLPLLANEMRMPTSEPPTPWLHKLWRAIADRTPAADAGIGAAHLPQLIRLFGSRRLLPLTSGEIRPLETLVRTLALPAELANRTLHAPGGGAAPTTPLGGDPAPAAEAAEGAAAGAEGAAAGAEGAAAGAEGQRAGAGEAMTVRALLDRLHMPLLHLEFVRERQPLRQPAAASAAGEHAATAAADGRPDGYFGADATDDRSLAATLIEKLASAHRDRPLRWHELPTAGARALVHLLATVHARSGAAGEPDGLLDASRRLALRGLPIFETCAADGQQLADLLAPRALLLEPHPFFVPSAAQAPHFLRPDVPQVVLEMAEALGARRLRDADVFESYLLPAFGSLVPTQQRAQREHILREWPTLRQHEGFLAALRETPFVPVGGGLRRPREVLDPRVDVLSFIFGGEAVFPDAEYTTEGWLALLAALGMKTSVDRGSFLDCARKVQAQAGCGPFGTPRHSSAPLTAETSARAELLSRYLIEHFTTLATCDDDMGASDFCSLLARVRFIPSTEPAAGVAPYAGEPVLACFAELALHQDRHLVWTAVPLLERQLTPPHSHWQDLGLLHPPPAAAVLAHALTLAESPPDAWPYPPESAGVEAVVGSLWAHIAERWHAMPAEVRARLASAPLFLCGASFVSAQRLFRSVYGVCQPLLQPTSALSCRPAPTDAILAAVGVRDEPSLSQLVRVLRELPGECGGALLIPSERRALVALLRLASECAGFRPDSALAVPTQAGLAVAADRCFVADAPWLLRRVRPGAIHLVSDAVDAPLRAKLQLRKLSDVVRVSLAAGSEPRSSEAHAPAAAELTRRMHSTDFAVAAATLLGTHAGWRDETLTAPPRQLRADAITAALRPLRVTLVDSLRTRLVMVESGDDVTRPYEASAGEGASAGGASGDELWFVRRAEGEGAGEGAGEILMVASPPEGLSIEMLLGQAVCQLLGCDPPAALTPLLTSELSRATTALEFLRVTPPPRWGVSSALGAPGTPTSAPDEARTQLVPLRAYFAGEVVCIDASHIGSADGGMVYAEMDESAAAGAAREQITLRVGSSRARVRLLPLHVHSFRSQRRAVGGRGDARAGAGAGAGDAQAGSEPPMEADGMEADGARPHGGADAPSGPSAAELVDAVSSVLRRAGVPIGLETHNLLEANLQMQADLVKARADAEACALDASRAKDQLESAERSITCQVCMQNRVDTLLNGCGHVLCMACASHIHDRCPFCRAELTTGTTRLRW